MLGNVLRACAVEASERAAGMAQLPAVTSSAA